MKYLQLESLSDEDKKNRLKQSLEDIHSSSHGEITSETVSVQAASSSM